MPVCSRPKVLVAESGGFPPLAAERLEAVAELVLADVDRPGLLRLVPCCDVLWVRLRYQVDAPVFDAARRLRLLVTPTTGLTHIDLAEARQRGVEVLSLRGESAFLANIRATAEHTLALILAVMRRLPAAVQHTRAGGWERDAFQGRELHGMTVGLIGYGRLGRLVSRLLVAFGARVLATDPAVPAHAAEESVALVPLDELLARSDLVSVHSSHDPGGRAIIGPGELRTMRLGTWLINTARGELLDEAALLQALESGHLAGAALDVLADEQRTDRTRHPLLAYARDHDNLIITPHIGGCTVESMGQAELFLANRLIRRLEANDARVHTAAG